ncbi:DNA polymerase III subunit epsilon [Chitinophaga oryziterrae]|uniref:DNA polymerase III subunit epsilon n=1 Tax=Chitinophaga oryziterrae TaxID=1031224 RepID=A0A6N8JG43_9BACT|nr:exonuclease domain-containing protein [Chitinophaga oryziterrae]MVT43924.1 DNA polymerase III subunit epsilon [Chitinophaga oryziterrae]
MYAIVDIETTGGHAGANGITEIAIFIYDGHTIVQQYETLVNPGVPIPRYIQSLTGITDEMTATAPPFEAVAPDVYDLLHDKIFVAHNVNFDYSFIQHHLLQAGYDLRTKKLCTVRLGRKIVPGLPSYSLGNLCRSLKIPVEQRHRAAGDAAATVRLFELLLKQDNKKAIATALNASSKEQFLPPNLPPEQVINLPVSPGVYYFHDQKGKVVYVGKAKNIKKRVNSHFTGNNPSRQRQEFLRNIHSITCEVTGTELMAIILESVEIKRLWPVYNRSQKNVEFKFGFYAFEDQEGYLRLVIEKKRKYTTPLHSFPLLVQGHQMLRGLIREFELCPRLCFLQKGEGKCAPIPDHTCRGACDKTEKADSYNLRVKAAINHMQHQQPSFLIVDEGREPEEQSCIMMEKGRFYGMGYIPRDTAVTEGNMVKEWLTQYPENEYILNIIHQFADSNTSRLLQFS